jgi:catechol 2,3-dioxygenase-like lactoylglutathione lyase family enzyme
MFRDAKWFSSYSVDDIETARRFYGETLGLDVELAPMGTLELKLAGDRHVTIYPKDNHEPATYTVLNFIVDDLGTTVDALADAGVQMEKYDMPGLQTDDRGMAGDPGGPQMAWFKDPAGNILGVLSLP